MAKITLSKDHNPNYICKIFKIEHLAKHSNADRLQVTTVDFQQVITGMDAEVGKVYIYFPVECKINKDFLSFTNSFRDAELNADKTKKGFFEANCRVKAMKLRGENSCGYIVPIKEIEEFTKVENLSEYVDQYFDMIGDIKILEKYIPKKVNTEGSGNKNNKNVVKKISRLVENQFRLHADTEQLRKNIWKIKPDDYIGIHYKKHGSSWIVGNVLVKKKLTWYEKFLKKVGVNIIDTEYDFVYSSRKVVKNEYETKNNNHFYGEDIWNEIKEDVKNRIPKGWTLYGEVLGYTKTGKPIQKDYAYGCPEGSSKVYIYRITITNSDGIVMELDDNQIKEFCEKNGFNYSDTFFYYGKAKDLYPEIDLENHWHEEFLKNLERDYTEKDCWMCTDKKVPEEGIVVRKIKLFEYEAYKLKSFRFLEKESKMLDAGVVDMETEESETVNEE